MPHSRPLPVVGKGCHELRVSDGPVEWRLVYAARDDAVVLLDVFRKKTQKAPSSRLRECAARIKRFDEARRKGDVT